MVWGATIERENNLNSKDPRFAPHKGKLKKNYLNSGIWLVVLLKSQQSLSFTPRSPYLQTIGQWTVFSKLWLDIGLPVAVLRFNNSLWTFCLTTMFNLITGGGTLQALWPIQGRIFHRSWSLRRIWNLEHALLWKIPRVDRNPCWAQSRGLCRLIWQILSYQNVSQ